MNAYCDVAIIIYIVSDIFHCFRTTNVVEMFGILFKISCLTEITVEYIVKKSHFFALLSVCK